MTPKELVSINLSVFLKLEARISKSETNTNNLNLSVPSVEGTDNIVILRGFENSSFEFVSDFDIWISRFRPVATDKLFLNSI